MLFQGEREHTVDPVGKTRPTPVPPEWDRVPDADHGIAGGIDDEELVLRSDLEQMGPELVDRRVVHEELGPSAHRPDSFAQATGD